MEKSDLLKLYGLALELVPDPDASGDLFMSCRDAAALLRRANRWRERQGLPALAVLPEPRPLLPAEAEHALHLARRGRLRRRLQVGAAILGLAVVVAAALLWAPAHGPVDGLAAHPVFREQPLRQFRHPAGYLVRIHRIEADPGSVHLWWSANGPGVREAASVLEPTLLLDAFTSRWLTPVETAVAAPRADRVVGRSTFETIVTIEQEAWVGFGEQRAGRPELLIRLPLGRRADESARTIQLDQVIKQGPVSIHLRSLVLGRNYTQIRYTASTDIGRAPALYTLEAGGRQLNRKGPLVASGDGLIEATFEPLPPEADRIYLTFTSVFTPLPPRNYRLPGQVEVYTRSGATATVVLALEDLSWGAAAEGYFVDAGGQRYPASLSFQVEGAPPRHRLMLRAEDLPPEADLVGVGLTGLRRYYHFREIELDVDLDRP